MRTRSVHPGARPTLADRAAWSVRRAFTILEMLITVSIIAIATIVILPAFNSILESTNFSSAVSTVTATLGNARAQAIKSNEFTAVAFLFDTETETYTLTTLVASNRNARLSPLGGPPAVAYRPADNVVPVTLPQGTGVYALSLQTANPGVPLAGDDDVLGWYAGEVLDDEDPRFTTPWIFPRSDPRLFMPQGQDPDAVRRGGGDNNADDALRHASSFMIQFSPNGTTTDAVPSGGRPVFDAYIEFPDRPVDRVDGDFEDGEFVPYDNDRAFDPESRGEFLGMTLTGENLDENPEVTLRAASQLAVVSLDKLAQGVAIEAPWLVRPPGDTDSDVAPKREDIDQDIYYDEDSVAAVSDWIDGNAEIIGFNRYTGNVMKRTN